MDALRDIVDLNQFVARGDATLGDAERLGVRRHPAARFEQYLGVLREASAFTYPRPFPWADDVSRRALFFEAASQVQQLIDAASIWKTLEPSLAAKKVRLIMSGSALPPTEDDAADVARNTLFEFTVAKALANKGFDVTLTEHDADVIATYPGLAPFDVECKRPTHQESLTANVKKAESQLRHRAAAAKLGFAVFGVERMLGLGRSTPNQSSFAELDRNIEEILRDQIDAVKAAEKSAQVSLFPHAALGGVLLTTSIFLEDRGGIFTISLMGLFATSLTSSVCREIQRTMSATIGAVALAPRAAGRHPARPGIAIPLRRR